MFVWQDRMRDLLSKSRRGAMCNRVTIGENELKFYRIGRMEQVGHGGRGMILFGLGVRVYEIRM
jgi:hypothetical protein